VATEIGQTYFL